MQTATFNSPLESALRSLFVLAAAPRRAFGMQRIVYFDYVLVHSADLGGPPSVHPRGQSQTGQLLVRRELIRQGLEILRSRDLVERRFASDGIKYGVTKAGLHVADHFESSYSKEIRSVATWIVGEFGSTSDAQLRTLMRSYVESWKDELITEAPPVELPW